MPCDVFGNPEKPGPPSPFLSAADQRFNRGIPSYTCKLHRNDESFAARAAARCEQVTARQASNVAYPAVRRPKVLREMAFRAARRRRDVARGRRDGAEAGGCDSMQLGRPSRRDGGVSAQVLGAAGGIGQPLSLLLKADPLVSGLSLYDVVNTPGVAADLSHCNTPATVTGVTGVGNAEEALKGADVVVIPAGSSFGVLFFLLGDGVSTAAYVTERCATPSPRPINNAGVPRKPGMTRDDPSNTNASIVRPAERARGRPNAFTHHLEPRQQHGAHPRGDAEEARWYDTTADWGDDSLPPREHVRGENQGGRARESRRHRRPRGHDDHSFTVASAGHEL